MMYERSLPTTDHIISMQEFTDHALQPALKNYRMHARSVYEKLPLSSAALLPAISWDTAELYDFYVPTMELNDGIIICDMRDALHKFPHAMNHYALSHTQGLWNKQKVLALVEACFNRAAAIIIPSHTHITMPLNIAELLGGYRQNTLFEKIMIFVGVDSSVTIHDTVQSSDCAAHTIIRAVDYVVEKGATVSIVYDHRIHSSTYNASRHTVYAAADSVIDYQLLLAGTVTSALWIEHYLQGKHAQSSIRGIYGNNAQQIMRITTHQHHQASLTHSNLKLQGIGLGASSVEYHGTICIEQPAHGSVANQDNNILLLSEHARAVSIPNLEIHTNDVQCTHGSAVGQLDKEQVWYMQSRGIDPDRAHALLIQGFLRDASSQEAVDQLLQFLGNKSI